MTSSVTKSFLHSFRKLPPEIQQTARKNFRLWLENPGHPSLHFKKIGEFWCARVGSNYRALAVWRGEEVEWFWIGCHDDYEHLLR